MIRQPFEFEKELNLKIVFKKRNSFAEMNFIYWKRTNNNNHEHAKQLQIVSDVIDINCERESNLTDERVVVFLKQPQSISA